MVFSCAKFSTGHVKCWGRGSRGELGKQFSYSSSSYIGDNEHPSTIGTISLGGQVSQLDAGGQFSCALLNYGSVRCWGANNIGQLGLGHKNSLGINKSPSSQSALIFPEKVIQIATGQLHSCVLLKDGKITCWGNNHNGELGMGHTNNIGDDESLLLNVSYVPIGGSISHIYPRFSFSPLSTRASSTIHFDASNSYSRSDILSYSWNFGNGKVADDMSTPLSMTSFTTPGLYTVNLTITDQDSRSSSLEKKIRIYPTNDPPLMPQDQKFTVEQGKSSVVRLLPAKGLNGSALTYRLVNTPSQGSLTQCNKQE